MTMGGDEYRNITDDLAKMSPTLKQNLKKVADDLSKNFIGTYISKKIDSIHTKGLRAEYSGAEIMEAVEEKKKGLLFKAIDDISLQTIVSLYAENTPKEERKTYSMDIFLFMLLSREERDVHKNAYSYLLSGETVKSFFSEKSLQLLSDTIYFENESSGGIDTITQIFYNTFSASSGLERESLVFPEPEHIARIGL